MALSDLVNDPYSAKRYLTEICAYDIAGTATMTVRVSDHRLVTWSGDSPAKALHEARIIEPINFQRSMFRSAKVGGSSRTNFGQLVLGNADAGLDTTAVRKLFGTLTGLYLDWGCAGQGPRKLAYRHTKPDRREANVWPKSLPIWTLLVTMTLTASCANINAPAGGCGWVKPISVAEEDRLTTATKRALLTHNEAWSEYCK
jgi:hypothetical protein